MSGVWLEKLIADGFGDKCLISDLRSLSQIECCGFRICCRSNDTCVDKHLINNLSNLFQVEGLIWWRTPDAQIEQLVADQSLDLMNALCTAWVTCCGLNAWFDEANIYSSAKDWCSLYSCVKRMSPYLRLVEDVNSLDSYQGASCSLYSCFKEWHQSFKFWKMIDSLA